MLDRGPIIKYHNQVEDFSSYEQAGFASRALAFFIDALILGIAQTIFATLFDFLANHYEVPKTWHMELNVIFIICSYIIIPSIYFIPQIKRGGQTIGKRAMRIMIIREDNTPQLSAGRIFLREIIGKALSAVFFGAGYIVRIFGLDTFHDKIAKTKVISLKVSR
ncbi:MAG: RDD family protein [Bacteriovoracaceae bacterium]|nr:RDD family protein [Bacteriovoracaceae bacterium]